MSFDSRSLLPSRWQILPDSTPRFQSPPPFFIPLDLRTGTVVSSLASGDCTVPGTLPKSPFINKSSWNYPFLVFKCMGFFFFLAACGISSDQESNLCTPHWKLGVNHWTTRGVSPTSEFTTFYPRGEKNHEWKEDPGESRFLVDS